MTTSNGMQSKRDALSTLITWLRYAIGWMAYAFLRTLVVLPLSWQLALGKRLGAVARLAGPGRRRVVERNLEVCFPEWPAERRREVTAAHFEALGASVAEMAMGWFGNTGTIRDRVEIHGREHLEAALARGRGVILYAGHFTTFEFYFPALRPLLPRLTGMYKLQRNPVMNRMMTRGRGRSVDALFAKDSVRGMLRELAANSVFWYASDQYYGGKGSALIPFFGVPAMTNTAISRIARVSGAVVLPYFCRRMPDDKTYRIEIRPPLEGFPTTDPAADTRRLVALLEDFVRTCPEQYWWIHRRFKGRPAPYPDIYRPAEQPGPPLQSSR